MLTDEEVRLFCRAKGIGDRGIDLIHSIRNNPPYRRVDTSCRSNNIPCRYPSKKLGRIIQANSRSLGLASIYLKEHDPDVLEYWDQPYEQLVLKYQKRNGKTVTGKASADFFVISESYIGFEEWKNSDALKKKVEKDPARYQWDEKNQRFYSPVVDKYLKPYGILYRFYTEKNINSVLVDNLAFLDGYFRQGEDNYSRDQEAEHYIDTTLNEEKAVTAKTLIENYPGNCADELYRMIAQGKVFVNLVGDSLHFPHKVTVYRDVSYWHASLQEDQISSANPPNKKVTLSPRLKFASPSDLNVAESRFRVVQQARTPQESVANLSKAEGIPQSTLYRWLKAVNECESKGQPGFHALIPLRHRQGNREPKLPKETLNTLKQIVDEHYLTKTQKSAHHVYTLVADACEKAEIPAPSRATFYDYLKTLSSHKVTLARKGAKAAHQETAYHGLDQHYSETPPALSKVHRVLERCHIDHTEMNIILVSEIGVVLGKPWVTIMIDEYSRRVMGFYITFSTPSYRSLMAVMRDGVKRTGYFPEACVYDGGKEFGSHYFEKLLAFFTSSGHSRKGKPRYGKVIERYFGSVNTLLLNILSGNTQATQQVRQMSASHDPKKEACWTLDRFVARFSEFIDRYDDKVHSELGCSPIELFNQSLKFSGQRLDRRCVYDFDFELMTLPTTPKGTVTVRKATKVTVKNVDYWHSAFRAAPAKGISVPVRYDPFDAGYIYVFWKSEWIRCHAVDPIFRGKSEREIQVASEEIRQQRSMAKKYSKISMREFADFYRSIQQDEEDLKSMITRETSAHKAIDPEVTASANTDSTTLPGAALLERRKNCKFREVCKASISP